jgi:hypothetical protein
MARTAFGRPLRSVLFDMLKLTLRSLRAHALRLALSSLAIVLGVAFIAGTMMFTDGMKAAAYAKVGVFDRHTDAAVYPADSAPANPKSANPNDQPTIDENHLAKVRRADGVRAAEGEVAGSGGGGARHRVALTVVDLGHVAGLSHRHVSRIRGRSQGRGLTSARCRLI